MQLTRFRPRYFGPYFELADLTVSPQMTVLTGANDSGKSLLLRAIALSCGDSQASPMIEEDVNNTFLFSKSTDWTRDESIGCIATFDLTNSSEDHFPIGRHPNIKSIEIKCSFAPNKCHSKIAQFYDSHKWRPAPASFTSLKSMPLTILLPREPDENIRNLIPLDSPNLPERELLELGFGGEYEPRRWTTMSEPAFATAISQAEERLTAAFHTVFGEHYGFRVRIRDQLSGNKRQIAFLLFDAHGSLTPLGHRGSGIRKAMRLLGVMHRVADYPGNKILLFDEPEASLHADAQHFLRSLLEEIATDPRVQVILSTHSPAMINGLRPEQVRLIQRDDTHGVPQSTVRNSVAHNGLQSVRASLGLALADTLLLSPITLLVEGVSERYGIPAILQLLADQSPHFRPLLKTMAAIAIWDCEGDSIDKCCGIVRSHGLEPVVWLDGDKYDYLKKRSQRTNHLDEVRMVLLDSGQEFENLINKEKYFDALCSLDSSLENCSLDSFKQWQSSNQSVASNEMLTKQIARWIQSLGINTYAYRKVDVIRAAIDTCEIGDIDTKPFEQLLTHLNGIGSP